jgi:hypothetical protein
MVHENGKEGLDRKLDVQPVGMLTFIRLKVKSARPFDRCAEACFRPQALQSHQPLCRPPPLCHTIYGVARLTDQSQNPKGEMRRNFTKL